MAVRTAEVMYLGDAASLIRASQQAAAATESSTAKIEAANAKVGASSAAAAAKSEAASARMGGSYLSMTGAAHKAAAELEGSHNKMVSSLTGIVRSGNLATAGLIGLGAAAYGIKKSTDAAMELAKETLVLHNVTGLTTQAASAYAAVAQVQGLNAKGLNQAFGTLSKNVQAVTDAHEGLTKAAKKQENAFRQIGLPLSAIVKAHGNMNLLLPEVTKRFEEMPGGIKKAAEGMALFGRGWQTLVPLMHSGALGLSEQLKVAKEMGITLGGNVAEQTKKWIQDQERAKYATLALKVAVAETLAPALGKLLHTMADVVHGLDEGVKWFHKEESVVIGFGEKILNVGDDWKKAMKVVEEGAQSMANFFIDRINEMLSAASQAAGKLSLGLTPSFGHIGHLSGAGMETQTERASKAQERVMSIVGEAHQRVLNTGGGIMGYFMSKGLTPAQAAGIVGNFQQESSLNPNLNSPEGIGLASWHDPGRIKALKDFAAQAHKSWKDVGVQLDFVWKELSGAGLAAVKAAGDPAAAARAFNKAFEGGTDPEGKRERLAERAYRAHPQQRVSPLAGEEERAPGNLGYYESAAHKAAKHAKARRPEDLSHQIDLWAEHSVGKFAESWGQNTGPELDKLQAEFHTHAAAWCAEFATTAAMMGGANKAVRTASVATIREWAQQGSHGYRQGVSHTPHVGDLMMFGDSHVGFVQSVHGGQVTTIEGNTGAGKVATRTHAISEGDYASPIYHSLKTGKVLLEKTGKEYEAAVKQAEHLILTGGQMAIVGGLIGSAAEAHGEAAMYGGYATEASQAWERTRPRQEQKRKPLSTARGAGEQTDIDQQDILTAQARKKYYEREVAALGREAKAWAKLRDQYRSFARHAHGGGKKEALNNAAAYDGKVKQAQAEAKGLEGTIADTEMQIEAAQEVLTVTLPGEIQAADLTAYQGALGKIALEERAGIITPEQAKKAKEAEATKALGGAYGPLSPEGLLQVKGDLREFSKALESATNAVEAHTNALKESAKALTDFLHASEGIAKVENTTLVKAMADLISGEIAGRNYLPRMNTPGGGSAARY